MAEIVEGKACIDIEETSVVTRKMETFYNPVMKFNRDMSIILLNALERQDMRICDPLAGTGIRSLRFLTEVPKKTIGHLFVNDGKPGFVETFSKHAKLSNITLDDSITITQDDASKILLAGPMVDYIDIDPFGSPNQFLDAACKKIKREGILAITATDTAPLCGTYPKACQRKYWAFPRRDYLMHEYGLRILIRKCQLVGAQYDKALIPIMSYSKDHYFRIFFKVLEGKTKVDELLKQHSMTDTYGPAWNGPLWDISPMKKIVSYAQKKFPEHESFLTTLLQEATINTEQFFDVHAYTKKLKIGALKHESIITKCKERNIPVSRTHFSPTGLRIACDEKTFIELLQEVHVWP